MRSRGRLGWFGATAITLILLVSCRPSLPAGATIGGDTPAPSRDEANRDSSVPERRSADSDLRADAGASTPELDASQLQSQPDASASQPLRPDGEMRQVSLEGFNPMVYVMPRSEVSRPAPLTVVLHGNFDRPEWECDIWRVATAPRGWTLCPRGYPRDDVDPSLDRWTYAGRGELAREITAGVSKLRALYPDEVTVEGSVLLGFSLGANMSPRLAGMKVLPFRAMILGEGGYQVTQSIARRAARSGIERVVYLCGERTICRRRVRSLSKLWRRAGVRIDTVVMPGVGHGYPEDFDELALRVFDALEREDP